MRPRVRRRVGFEPDVTYFKPVGVGLYELEEINLSVDELEAIRLKDLLGLDQTKAAKKMGISQSTFHRLLLSAHKKVADSLVNGKAIKVKGGIYEMVQKNGRGMGFGGPGGFCVCPACGHKEPKVRSVPCRSKKCPECGTKMVRSE